MRDFPDSYDTMVGGLEDPEVISNWHIGQEVRTGKYSVTDYNFITPSTNLLKSTFSDRLSEPRDCMKVPFPL